MSFKQTIKKPDTVMFAVTVGLLVFGVLMVYDASVVYAQDVLGGKYHFLLRQLFWVVLGSVAAVTTFFASEKGLRRISIPLFGISLLFLLFLAVPQIVSFPLYDKFAPEINGARRWIIINPSGVLPAVPLLSRISFQPSELMKLSLIFYFAHWFASSPSSTRGRISIPGKKKNLPGLFSVLFLICICGGLVLLQPDFATTGMIAVLGFWIYFIAGASVLPLFLSSLAGLGLGLGFILSSPYRRERLLTFLRSTQADPLSAGYHLRQILIALGSGGLLGVGVGQSRQKYGYLPEAVGDSIFAIIGEEFGFMGTASLVVVFIIFLWRSFRVVKQIKDPFLKYVAGGVTGWIGVQVLVNLAAMTALIPLTGITLPFVSYGGSSIIFLMAGVGALFKASAQISG